MATHPEYFKDGDQYVQDKIGGLKGSSNPPINFNLFVEEPDGWGSVYNHYSLRHDRPDPLRKIRVYLQLQKFQTATREDFIHDLCVELAASSDYLNVSGGNSLNIDQDVFRQIEEWWHDPGEPESGRAMEPFRALWTYLLQDLPAFYDAFVEDVVAYQAIQKMTDTLVPQVQSTASTARPKAFNKKPESEEDFVEVRPANVTWTAEQRPDDENLGSVKVSWNWETKGDRDAIHRDFRSRLELAAIPSNVLSTDGKMDASTEYTRSRKSAPLAHDDSIEIMRKWWGSSIEELVVISESDTLGGDSWVDTLYMEYEMQGSWAQISEVTIRRTLLNRGGKVVAKVELSGPGGATTAFEHEVPGSRWSKNRVSEAFQRTEKSNNKGYVTVEKWDRDKVQAKNADNQKKQWRTKGQDGGLMVHVAAPYFLIGTHDEGFIDSLKTTEDGSAGEDAKRRYDAGYELGWATIKRGRFLNAGTISVSGVANKHNQGCIEQAVSEYSDKKVVFEAD